MNKQRDYSHFDQYYEELLQDVYPQPCDDYQLEASKEIITEWIFPLEIHSVLDVGCGDLSAKKFFEMGGASYTGISVGDDGERVGAKREDFNFLGNDVYDLVFARHSLEHSPFPLITLMEWHRVSSRYLCVVLPNPEHYTYVGRNHYSVMTSRHAAWLLRRAGWKALKFFMDNEEIWFLCQKYPRIGYEGWAKIPLSTIIYGFERDVLTIKGEVDVKEHFFGKESKHETF